MNGRSAVAAVATQLKVDARAKVARHIEHQFESCAGTHRKLVIERFERLARLAVDGHDEDFCAAYRDARKTRSRGAAKTQPHTCAGPGLELERRGRPVGENDAALAPASPADGGIGEIVLDLPARVDVPVGQHHRRIEIDVRRLRLVDDDRPE